MLKIDIGIGTLKKHLQFLQQVPKIIKLLGYSLVFSIFLHLSSSSN